MNTTMVVFFSLTVAKKLDTYNVKSIHLKVFNKVNESEMHKETNVVYSTH